MLNPEGDIQGTLLTEPKQDDVHKGIMDVVTERTS